MSKKLERLVYLFSILKNVFLFLIFFFHQECYFSPLFLGPVKLTFCCLTLFSFQIIRKHSLDSSLQLFIFSNQILCQCWFSEERGQKDDSNRPILFQNNLFLPIYTINTVYILHKCDHFIYSIFMKYLVKRICVNHRA